MKRLLGLTCFVLGSAAFAFGLETVVPEIDATSGAAALALLSGGLVVLRARKTRNK